MSVLALPFAARGKKEALSKKYKVSGIPTLIILDGEGNLITKDGRSAVTEDPTGEQFPWRPKELTDCLAEIPGYVGAGGAKVGKEATAGKTIGLYFSAHWCPPCRGFTPELAKTYNAMKAAGNDDFEIVFVSSDDGEAAFKEYHAEQPWLALPYEHRQLKEDLSKALEVQGIPTLVIIGPDGQVINKDGRAALSKDPKGENFPWVPPPYTDLEDSSSINDEPTVVVFADGCDAAAAAVAEAAVREVAAAAVAAGGAERYAIAKPGDDLAGRLRELTKLGAAGATATLALIDLADDQAFYTSDAKVDAGSIKAMVDGFRAKTLTRQKLAF